MELTEHEYADTAAKHARGITLLSSLYESRVLVGIQSMEFCFRTVIENDNLASMARMVRWYEGNRGDVDRLIDEESINNHTVDEEPFEFGYYLNSKYSAKLRALGIRVPDFDGTARDTHEILHHCPQVLPFFLPKLKALNYQHNPRIHGFNLLSRYKYRPQDALSLTDISIRAACEDSLKLTVLLPLFSRSRGTLENLHLERPLDIEGF